MPQDQSSFRSRLQEAGQWEVFCARRKEIMALTGSKRQSWEQAAREFGWQGPSAAAPARPAAAPSVPEDSPYPEIRPQDFKNKPPTTLRQDLYWVYQSIALDGITPKDAPSIGAWGLLDWARRNPESFYRTRVLSGDDLLAAESQEKDQYQKLMQRLKSRIAKSEREMRRTKGG